MSVEGLLAARAIAAAAKHDVHHGHALGAHAGIDGVQVGDAAREQRRTCGDHHRERDLGDHETVLQASATPVDPSGAGPAQRRRADRRDRARSWARGSTSTAAATAIAMADGEHAPVRRRGLGPRAERQRAGDDARNRSRRAPRRARPRRPATSSTSTTSCCDQPAPVRAERRTNRELRGPRVDLSEHQRGDVGAPDQQDQRHRAERREQRRPHRPEQVVAQRRDVRRSSSCPTAPDSRTARRAWPTSCATGASMARTS